MWETSTEKTDHKKQKKKKKKKREKTKCLFVEIIS